MAIQDRRTEDVAVGMTLEVTGGVIRVLSKPPEVAQGIVAVAIAFAVDDDSRLPASGRRPEQLSLACKPRSRIEIVAGQIVDGVAIAPALPE
jgi:hypothetical protein